jgi:hypothetical protein
VFFIFYFFSLIFVLGPWNPYDFAGVFVSYLLILRAIEYDWTNGVISHRGPSCLLCLFVCIHYVLLLVECFFVFFFVAQFADT